MSTALAVTPDWLNATESVMTTSSSGFLGDATSSLTFQYYYPYWTYPVYVAGPERPIKLTMSEVERLRKAARADKALKAILSKFTSQIEITVDFD